MVAGLAALRSAIAVTVDVRLKQTERQAGGVGVYFSARAP